MVTSLAHLGSLNSWFNTPTLDCLYVAPPLDQFKFVKSTAAILAPPYFLLRLVLVLCPLLGRVGFLRFFPTIDKAIAMDCLMGFPSLLSFLIFLDNALDFFLCVAIGRSLMKIVFTIYLIGGDVSNHCLNLLFLLA